MNDFITVIGGGLAGTEAAYQIAKRGIKVKLYEMKPQKFSPAHSNKNLAEIVCSNSFKSNLLTNACGLLKEELRMLDSLLIKIADETSVPAGQALAVDREKFSERVTEELEKNQNIEIIHKEVGVDELNIKDMAKEGIVIIATGPLTSDDLAKEIKELTGDEGLHFYDAAAPIVEKDSIDMNIAFWGDRYDQERAKDEDIEDWKKRIANLKEADYINLPMNKEEYENFVNELINSEVVELHEFEKREIFEGCMPIEIMAKRGLDTLRFGPLKPVGFTDPRTGFRPYAVVQLRQDNKEGSIYNIVGFQTNLKFGEQKRVFSMIPGLENANYVKYGVMHRNTFINSPELLDATYNFKQNNNIFFAGQITGVEGYVESISSGLVAGINACLMYEEKINKSITTEGFSRNNKMIFGKETMIGALADYVSTENKKFQPMNANFGILPELSQKIRDKKERYGELAKISIDEISTVYIMSEIRACTKGATNKRINQDYAITTGNIVVCFDGCGPCENSQVGVHKMAEIILDNSNNITVDNFENFVLENLYELVLANSHKERCETELFFTILACIETDEKFVVFTCGDGYIITVSHEQQIQYFKLNNNTTIHDGGAPGYPIIAGDVEVLMKYDSVTDVWLVISAIKDDDGDIEYNTVVYKDAVEVFNSQELDYDTIIMEGADFFDGKLYLPDTDKIIVITLYSEEYDFLKFEEIFVKGISKKTVLEGVRMDDGKDCLYVYHDLNVYRIIEI